MSPNTGTGSVQTPSHTPSPYSEKHALPLMFLNDSGGPLTVGQEVVFSGDNSVSKRATGASIPVGTVKVGGDDGDNVTVETIFNRDLQVIVAGAPIAAGTPVVPNGLNTNGIPQYIAAVGGNFVLGVAITGGAVGAQIRIGICRSSFQI